MSRFDLRSTPGAALRGPFPLDPTGQGATHDGYDLPRVRLLAEVDGLRLPTVEVDIPAAVDDSLRRWLLAQWCRPVQAGQRAFVATPLTQAVRLPGDLAARAAGQEVPVTWTVTWGGGATQATARLVMPAAGPSGDGSGATTGAHTGTASAAADSAARDDEREQALGFVVIDFGTTAITATMSYHDEVDLSTPLDTYQADVLAARLAAVLGGEGPAEVGADEWARILTRVSAELAARRPHDGLPGVLVRLGEGKDERHELLGALAAALDVVVQPATPALRVLARLRDDCYRAAFATPPHDRVGMFPVTFDGDGVPFSTLSSAVHITDLADLRVRLWHRQVPPPQVVATLRGLKSHFRTLGAPLPLETVEEIAELGDEAGRAAVGHTTADLVERSYGALREHLSTFARTNERIIRTITDDRTRRLLQRRVVVTYPTLTPPDIRDHLTEVVGRALRDQDTGDPADTSESEFDEAVGAAFYFTMLAVGASEELGVEVLRAGAHPVGGGDGPARWRRMILVIDIGGGTTDIALVALNLTEIPTGGRGRRLELRPEVLGATGDPQLGGNYITLRVLYWIKAMLADRLLAWEAGQTAAAPPSAPTPDAPDARSDVAARSLTAQVLDQGVDKPVSPEVARRLHELVPTRGEQNAALFDTLWEKSEEAKTTLGQPDQERPFTIRNAQTLVALPPRFAQAPPIDLSLSVEDFAKVAGPVVRRAASIAADLVVGVFNADDGVHAPRLDQVALCGRTSAMPMVRDAVVDRLARTDLRARVPLVWNDDAVVVERTAAKEAVSMGVAWAVGYQHNKRYSAGRDPDVDIIASHGGLQIETDALFTRLPASFGPLEAGGVKDILLRTGDPLIGGRRGVRPTARSQWDLLRNDFELGRLIDSGRAINWARFRIRDYARGHDVSGSLYTGGRAHRGPRVLMQVGIDDAMTASVSLSVGRGHLLVDGVGQDISAALPGGPGGSAGRGPAGRGRGDADAPTPIAWSWPLVAVAAGTRDPRSGRVVLPVPADAARAYPETFVRIAPREPAQLPGHELAGVLSRVPLPPLDGAAGWDLYACPPEGAPVQLGELAVPPGEAAPGATYLLSLDETGRARVHLGWPDFLAARGLADLERHHGSVLTTPMAATLQNFDPYKYPFNGLH